MARRWDLPQLKQTLKRLGLEFSIVIPDVAQHLAEARERTEIARSKSSRMDWVSYHTYEEVKTNAFIAYETLFLFFVMNNRLIGSCEKVLQVKIRTQKIIHFVADGISPSKRYYIFLVFKSEVSNVIVFLRKTVPQKIIYGIILAFR